MLISENVAMDVLHVEAIWHLLPVSMLFVLAFLLSHDDKIRPIFPSMALLRCPNSPEQ